MEEVWCLSRPRAERVCNWIRASRPPRLPPIPDKRWLCNINFQHLDAIATAENVVTSVERVPQMTALNVPLPPTILTKKIAVILPSSFLGFSFKISCVIAK